MKTLQRTITDVTRRLNNRLGENGVVGWLLPYRGLAIPAKQWDREYDSGAWERLDTPGEVGRYGVIAACCRGMAPGPRILDVGCGEGVLHDYLIPAAQQEYTGLDISATAISRARQQRNSGKFIVADSSEFETNERFDAIVFNECLYYFDEPTSEMARYAAMLNDNGIIVVSAYASPRTHRFWARLQRHFRHDEEIRLQNGAGGRWTIRLYRGARP